MLSSMPCSEPACADLSQVFLPKRFSTSIASLTTLHCPTRLSFLPWTLHPVCHQTANPPRVQSSRHTKRSRLLRQRLANWFRATRLAAVTFTSNGSVHLPALSKKPERGGFVGPAPASLLHSPLSAPPILTKASSATSSSLVVPPENPVPPCSRAMLRSAVVPASPPSSRPTSSSPSSPLHIPST